MSDALQTTARLTPDAARQLTAEVKADAAALWSKLLALYDGGAHTALGYASWGDYYEAEFDESRSRGYQILAAARVVVSLPVHNCGLAPDTDRPLRDPHTPAVPLASAPAPAPPATESVARELVPVPEPERPAVWQAANEQAAAEDRPVTAADVRQAREAIAPRAPAAPPAEQSAAEEIAAIGRRTAGASRMAYKLAQALALAAECRITRDLLVESILAREQWWIEMELDGLEAAEQTFAEIRQGVTERMAGSLRVIEGGR